MTMTLINEALNRFGLRVRANGGSQRPGWLYGGGATFDQLGEDWSKRRLQQQAIKSAWVYSDINLLARKVGSAKICVYEMSSDGTKRIEDHEFEKLMRRPNPLMSGRFLMQYTTMWFNLDGNAYWWLSQNHQKKLVEIWPLPARDVTPVKAGKGSNEVLAGYRYSVLGADKIIPPEFICHFRLANPFNVLKGLSPISALKSEITGDLAMKAWNVNFFDKRNAMPTTIISLPATTSETDFNRIRDQIERQFGGVNRRSMVIRAGEVSAEQVGISQKDMDFLSGIVMNRETVDRGFGIPAGYWAKDASRNVSATAELIVMRDTVQPTVDYFAEEIDAQIIDRYYDKELIARADNLVPEDRGLAISEFKTYSTVMTVDEARELQNLEPLGGELGATLVPLATRPAPGLGGSLGIESPTTRALSAAEADLRNWETIALREIGKGRNPSAREFVSDDIPNFVKAQIEGALSQLVSGDEVKALFSVWNGRLAEGWLGYP